MLATPPRLNDLGIPRARRRMPGNSTDYGTKHCGRHIAASPGNENGREAGTGLAWARVSRKKRRYGTNPVNTFFMSSKSFYERQLITTIGCYASIQHEAYVEKLRLPPGLFERT